jgi:hypothetical protein
VLEVSLVRYNSMKAGEYFSFFDDLVLHDVGLCRKEPDDGYWAFGSIDFYDQFRSGPRKRPFADPLVVRYRWEKPVRQIVEVVTELLKVIPETEIVLRSKLDSVVRVARYSAPETQFGWFESVGRIIDDILPRPDQLSDWQKDVVRIWTTRSIEEFPFMEGTNEVIAVTQNVDESSKEERQVE